MKISNDYEIRVEQKYYAISKVLPMKLKPCVFNLKLQRQSLKSATRLMPRSSGFAIGWIAMTLPLLIMMTS